MGKKVEAKSSLLELLEVLRSIEDLLGNRTPQSGPMDVDELVETLIKQHRSGGLSAAELSQIVIEAAEETGFTILNPVSSRAQI